MNKNNANSSWGPDRATFTIEHPASYVTFNSITNNPNYGDERNFMLIKDAANTKPGGWSKRVEAQPGKEYIIRLYLHHNAASNYRLLAENVRISVNIPAITDSSIKVWGFIEANNANPPKVWNEVTLHSNKQFNVSYVPGSAHYYNNENPNPGFELSDSIVTRTGALVGYESMDGWVPGCFQYTGIATLRVMVR